jgi:hypothetical protein
MRRDECPNRADCPGLAYARPSGQQPIANFVFAERRHHQSRQKGDRGSDLKLFEDGGKGADLEIG